MASADTWRVVYVDGRDETLTVGRPAVLVWFADTFGRDPADEGLAAYADAARLLHREIGPDAPFAEWIETVKEIESPRRQARKALEAELGEDEEEASPQEPPEDQDETPSPAATENVAASLDSR